MPPPMKRQRRQFTGWFSGALLTLLAPALSTRAQAGGATTAEFTQRLAERLRFGWLGRSDVQSFISEMTDRHGWPREWLETHFAQIKSQPRALSLMNPPPPSPDEPARKRSWARYQSQHADQSRVELGRAFMEEHAKVFRNVSKQSGVPPEVIAAILGVETKFGKITGSFPAFETLATLAFDSPRRGDFFRQELESLLWLAKNDRLSLTDTRGSFAGALGFPQFMPSSWRRFAIGYRSKNEPDLLGNPHDAIASIGNFLKMHGWVRGAPSHVHALANEGSNPARFVAPKLTPVHTVAEIESAGIRQAVPDRLKPATAASLIDLPESDDTVSYWFAAQNFFVITQYNRSFMYAAAVLTLADSLANSPGADDGR